MSKTVTIKHGKHGTPTYWSWASMIQRCTNPKSVSYDRYGARGIKVCDRWLESFENFYADMGDRPAGTTLDREDGDGNYEPGNCRWATDEVQNNNTSHNHLITDGGVTKTIAEWARERGIKHRTIRMRLMRGTPPVEAIQPGYRKHGPTGATA